MLKTSFENYHINFSNSDFSVDIASICNKFLVYVLHSLPEGSVSQNFFTIIYVLCHKKLPNT